jgi:hypothetical protein
MKYKGTTCPHALLSCTPSTAMCAPQWVVKEVQVTLCCADVVRASEFLHCSPSSVWQGRLPTCWRTGRVVVASGLVIQQQQQQQQQQ